MKKIILLIMFITLSCNVKNDPITSNSEIRNPKNKIPFDIKKAKVINTIIIPESEQTIVLLADSVYMKDYSLKKEVSKINKGTILAMHWKQMKDPLWIGAKIPGEYLYADLIYLNDTILKIKRYTTKGKEKTLEKDEINKIITLIHNISIAQLP